jgi:CDP-diacylglycerol--glycerol-3-phosphate 3-phosphatidyltransferase
MGIYAIKPKFQQLLDPVATGLARARIHPDVINAAGLGISYGMAGVLLLAAAHPGLFWVLPAGAFLRTACNALDGMVARRLGVSSPFGEVINELFDRLSDAAILLAVGLGGLASLALTALGTSLVLVNSYVGIIGKAAGYRRIYSGILGKADRMIIVGVSGIVSIFASPQVVWNTAMVIVVAGSAVSICQRISAIRKDVAR